MVNGETRGKAMTKEKLLKSLDNHVRTTVTQRSGNTETGYPPEWEWICERLAELQPPDYEEQVKQHYPDAYCELVWLDGYMILNGKTILSQGCSTERLAWMRATETISK